MSMMTVTDVEVGRLAHVIHVPPFDPITYAGMVRVTPYNLDIPPTRAYKLAGVRVRETCEWWWLDSDTAADELKRYYREQHGLHVTVGHEISLFRPC